MAGELRIRAAGAADLDALFAVERDAALAAFAHVFPPERYPYPDAEARARLSESLASAETRLLVAESEGAVLAFVSFGGGLVHKLYVAPDAWAEGIGSRLLEAAVAGLRAGGSSRPRLWVLEQNARARALYERRGWRADGETRRTPFPPHPTLVRYVLEDDGSGAAASSIAGRPGSGTASGCRRWPS